MIFNLKENADHYLGISRNMDTALNWLKKADLLHLPDGRTGIDGDAVFVNVMNAVTKDKQEARFEFHRKYYDIQILISGKEDILFGSDAGRITVPYKEDIGFCDCPETAAAHLSAGCFVICEPLEPHAPCITPEKPDPIRKAVIKVLK